MNFEYAKDSKEQRPYEHYLNAYREMDPKEHQRANRYSL